MVLNDEARIVDAMQYGDIERINFGVDVFERLGIALPQRNKMGRMSRSDFLNLSNEQLFAIGIKKSQLYFDAKIDGDLIDKCISYLSSGNLKKADWINPFGLYFASYVLHLLSRYQNDRNLSAIEYSKFEQRLLEYKQESVPFLDSLRYFRYIVSNISGFSNFSQCNNIGTPFFIYKDIYDVSINYTNINPNRDSYNNSYDRPYIKNNSNTTEITVDIIPLVDVNINKTIRITRFDTESTILDNISKNHTYIITYDDQLNMYVESDAKLLFTKELYNASWSYMQKENRELTTFNYNTYKIKIEEENTIQTITGVKLYPIIYWTTQLCSEVPKFNTNDRTTEWNNMNVEQRNAQWQEWFKVISEHFPAFTVKESIILILFSNDIFFSWSEIFDPNFNGSLRIIDILNKVQVDGVFLGLSDIDQKIINDFINYITTDRCKDIVHDNDIERLHKRIKKLIGMTEEPTVNITKWFDYYSQGIVQGEKHNTFFTSDLIDIRYTLTTQIKIPRIDLLEIFNEMDMNYYLPFARIGKFFKVLNGIYVPDGSLRNKSDNWLEESETEDELIFYIRTKDEKKSYDSILRDEDFCEIKVQHVKDEQDSSLFNIEISADNGITVSDIIRKVISVFKSKIQNEIVFVKKFGIGKYLIKDININEYVLFDFAMNHPICKNVMTINEKHSIHKKKGGTKLLMHKNINSDHISFTIDTVTDIKSNEDVSNYFNNYVNYSERDKETVYIITIKGNFSNDQISLHKKLFETVLYCMLQEYKNFYVNFYKQYINGIDSVIQTSLKVVDNSKINILKTYKDNSDIFGAEYSRWCATVNNLWILNKPVAEIKDEEFNSLGINKNDIMVFPKNSDLISTNNKLTGDKNRKQFSYVCKNSFIGLKHNRGTIGNKEKYPLSPCCFEQDQRNNQYSLRYRYEKENKTIDEIAGSIETTYYDALKIDLNSGVLKLKPISHPGQRAELSSSILYFLQSADLESITMNKTFYRVGIKLSPQSIIDAIIFAFANKKNHPPINKAKILETCQLLAKNNMLCQSGISSDLASQIINDGQFIDPLIWKPVLEHVFNAKIIIFQTKDEEFEIKRPNYSRFWTEPSKHYDNTILIYETLGSQMFEVEYPHYELIISQNMDIQEVTTVFEFTPLIQTCVEIQENIMTVKMYEPVLEKSINSIVYQSEDILGKIRQIGVLIDKEVILVHTDPIYPLAILNTNKYTIREKCNLEKGKKVFTSLFGKADLFGSYVDDKFVGILTWKYNICYFIRIDDNNIDEINKLQKINYCPITLEIKENTIFKLYNSYTCISNSLISYMLYLFSTNFTTLEQIDKLYNNMSSSDLFFENNSIIVEGHEYIKPIRSISLQNSNFIRDGDKLIISSEDLMYKLKFILDKYIKFDIGTVLDYKWMKYIPNFYINSKDFNSQENSSIYHTINEYILSRTSKNMKDAYIPKSSLSQDVNYSFFFQNSNVLKERLFIAHPFDSLHKALMAVYSYNENESILEPIEDPNVFKYNLHIQHSDTEWSSLKLMTDFNREVPETFQIDDVIVKVDIGISNIDGVGVKYWALCRY